MVSFQKKQSKIICTFLCNGMLNQIYIKSNFTDNSPICPSPEYEIELSEGAPVGTYVISVEASDPDVSKLAVTWPSS